MNPLLKALVWIDVQIFWIITLGNARPGETISAAAWSLEADGKWQGKLFRPLIDALFYMVQKDHCLQAYIWQKDIYK